MKYERNMKRKKERGGKTGEEEKQNWRLTI
jgi:hypothetical protein